MLRQQLQTLLDEARLNERKLQRLGSLEKRLIATGSLSALIRVVLEDYRSSFEIDIVTLVLADPEYEITRILERERVAGALPGLVVVEKLHGNTRNPYLGAFDTDLKNAIFDPWPSGCRSMALLPLFRQNEQIGSLNIGSRDAQRFAADSNADFLERLSGILSICIENALNLERLKLAGLTDPLTGIHNRRYFEARCREEVSHARRHRLPLACLFLDIDKFKRINDEHGHLAGDAVLRKVARLVKSQLRGNDVLARYGGEEFVALLPQIGQHKAREIAERIRLIIAGHAFQALPDMMLQATLSIGIAMLPDTLPHDDTASSLSLISAADAALYQAKEAGRNRVVCAAIAS